MRSMSPLKLFCLVVLFLPSIVLHICGFFSPYWVNEKSSFECFRGLLYTVDCPDNIDRLSGAVLGLQSISMIFIIISTINTVYSFGCTKEDDTEEISCYEHCTVFIFCLYPFAGIFSFVSCIIISSSYYDDRKGWGFYLNLVASGYIFLQMCCASIFADRDERNDRPTRQRAVQYINNTGGVVVIGHVVKDREIHIGATS